MADILSRPTEFCNVLYEEMLALNFAHIAKEQSTDPEIAALIKEPHSLQLVSRSLPGSNVPLIVDKSTDVDRPLVPASCRKHVFDVIHNLSHPGIKTSQNSIAKHFVWPRMKAHIREFAKTCLACQRNKVSRHNSAPYGKFHKPDSRFATIHCDIVGPLTRSNGFTYLLTVIDRFTRHFEAIPLTHISAKNCADNFMLHWVSRFGCPKIIVADRGTQFTSSLWHDMARFLGAKIIHTTSFHPQSNGMCERLHRSLKVALRAQNAPSNWFSNLGVSLLGLRSAVKQDLGVSTGELTIGSPLRVPGQFFSADDDITPPSRTEYRNNLMSYVNNLTAVAPRICHNKKAFLDKALQTCTHVFVRDDQQRPPLAQTYCGPFPVLQKCDKYFVLDFGTKSNTVSIDRLKAAHLLMEKINPTAKEPNGNTNVPSFSEPPITKSHHKKTVTFALPSTHTNRYGRTINPPKRFSSSA